MYYLYMLILFFLSPRGGDLETHRENSGVEDARMIYVFYKSTWEGKTNQS